MRLPVAVLCCAGLAAAQADVAFLLEQETVARIRAYDEAREGVLGVAAIDLTTGQTLLHNANIAFPAASTIKVPIMIEVFRAARAGRLRLDQQVTLDPKELIDGSDRLALPLRRGPASLTVRELVEAMIEVSDNTATNRLIELAGMDSVNGLLDELRFPVTRLRRKMLDAQAAARDEENVSTPLELARIVELIYRNKAAPDQDCAAMLGIMKRVEASFRRVIPAKVEVAAKVGELPGARCETGVVYLPTRPYVLAVMSAYLRDGDDPAADIATLVHAQFEKLARSNRFGRRIE